MLIKSMLLTVVVILFGSVARTEAQTFVNGGAPGPGTALGWNYGHIAFCATFSDGVSTWYYAFAEGGGYGYTNNPVLVSLISPACQTGNLVAIHVISLNPFLWNWIATYPFK
jgi:hypothetical protein